MLADETMDICGIEQLSICIRYILFENGSPIVREDFLGFIALNKLDAESISNEIIKSLLDWGFDLNKLIGQGFDGAITMSGHINGVQKRIRDKYIKAIYVHCSSHKLNLVLNELNSIPEIRNTIAIIKETINFFNESSLRKSVAPSLTKLWLTRWSEYHKALKKFYENYIAITEALDYLKVNSNKDTSVKSVYISNSITTLQFLVCLKVIAKYSAIIEPITNTLQGVDVDLFGVQKHVQILTEIILADRTNSEQVFNVLMDDVRQYADDVGIDFLIPRMSSKQTLRSNYSTNDPIDYYRISVFLPYLDSLISSLKFRFNEKMKMLFLYFFSIQKI